MANDTSRRPGSPPSEETKKFGKTVLQDLSQSDFQRSMHRDLEDVYHLFLDTETKKALDEKDETSRWLYMVYWLLKGSILKLPPPRRLLLLGGLLLFAFGVFGNFAALITSFLALLLVLMLELKDKLLAQDELETGRAVQFALMPREQPVLSGWEVWLFNRPANEVGGDLVDYLQIDERRLGIALGDVAGKGLGAALVTAKLQATLRALAPGSDSLAALGRTVNEIFLRDGLPNRFVSMAYLELEPDSGVVRVLNAGHLPPIAVHAEGIEEMPKGAPALGLTRESDYREQCLALEHDDLVLVYSDGLTEARNEQGEFFSDERLAALLPRLRGLSAEAAGMRLLGWLERFVGEARPSDDLSLVLLKRCRPKSLAAATLPVEETSDI